MIIPCISCHRQFRLNNRLVKPTGSMVRCSNCQHIFVVYPMPEDPAAEPQRANQGQNRPGSSSGACDSGTDKPKMPVEANRNLNSEKQPSGGLREPVQGQPSILDGLFGLDQPAIPQEATTGNHMDRKDNSLAVIADRGEATPDSEGQEIEYADLPDIAEIENSIDWSDVRAADESNS